MARFEFETVSDELDLVRGQSSLVLDHNDDPRAAYTIKTGEIVIASSTAGTWMREKLSGPIVAAGTEDRVWLQVDSAGDPHLAYIEEGTRRLIYGVRGRDLRWSFTSVPTHLPPHEPVISGVSFVMHPGGQNADLLDTPHISFEDQSTNSLGYARKVDGVWRVSHAALPVQIGDAGSSRTGQSTSLIFNESQSLQIAYVETFEVTPTTAVHTKRVLSIKDGTFGIERSVEKGPFFVGRTSILSETPETWVTYCDITNRVIKAATFSTDDDPVVEVVAPILGRTVPMLTRNPTIGGGLADRLRIAYADDGKIMLARRERLRGWSVEVVDPEGGEMPALAYDKRGRAHLVYIAGQALSYAKGQPE